MNGQLDGSFAIGVSGGIAADVHGLCQDLLAPDRLPWA